MGSSSRRLNRREVGEVLGGRERDVVVGEKRLKVGVPGLEVIQIAAPEVSISKSIRRTAHGTRRGGSKSSFGQPLTFSGISPP